MSTPHRFVKTVGIGLANLLGLIGLGIVAGMEVLDTRKRSDVRLKLDPSPAAPSAADDAGRP